MLAIAIVRHFPKPTFAIEIEISGSLVEHSALVEPSAYAVAISGSLVEHPGR